MTLRPFFSYYGGKWTLAPHYPLPEHAVFVRGSSRHPEQMEAFA